MDDADERIIPLNGKRWWLVDKKVVAVTLENGDKVERKDFSESLEREAKSGETHIKRRNNLWKGYLGGV